MKKVAPEVLSPVESIRVVGPCKVEVGRFGMRHGKIGDGQVARGRSTISGKSAMAIDTYTETGENEAVGQFSWLRAMMNARPNTGVVGTELMQEEDSTVTLIFRIKQIRLAVLVAPMTWARSDTAAVQDVCNASERDFL